MTKTISCFLSFIFLILTATEARADLPGFMLAQMGTLTGKVELPEPMPKDGVFVSFFNVETGPPPNNTTVRRVPDMVVHSASDGTFEVQLMPGAYNIGALIRDREAGIGPPRPGEKFFFAMEGKGKLLAVKVLTKGSASAGTVKFSPPENTPALKDYFTVEGVVTDEKGAVEGAVVLVKTDLSQLRPLFISEPTKKDGTFQINLPAEKNYYLMARQGMEGKKPTPGSYVGTYGKKAPAQGEGTENRGVPPVGRAGGGGEGEALIVTGKAGEKRTGINISMFRIPDPETNRLKYQKDNAQIQTKPAFLDPPRPQ